VRTNTAIGQLERKAPSPPGLFRGKLDFDLNGSFRATLSFRKTLKIAEQGIEHGVEGPARKVRRAAAAGRRRASGSPPRGSVFAVTEFFIVMFAFDGIGKGFVGFSQVLKVAPGFVSADVRVAALGAPAVGRTNPFPVFVSRYSEDLIIVLFRHRHPPAFDRTSPKRAVPAA
jgi:hypothetical protein